MPPSSPAPAPAELTETNAAQSTGGDLNATDVDSPATFMPQTNVTGSNGYGKFTIAADGTWTYVMDNAHDEFVGGARTHRFPHCRHRRRHHQVLTVTMHGTNDARSTSPKWYHHLTELSGPDTPANGSDAVECGQYRRSG